MMFKLLLLRSIILGPKYFVYSSDDNDTSEPSTSNNNNGLESYTLNLNNTGVQKDESKYKLITLRRNCVYVYKFHENVKCTSVNHDNTVVWSRDIEETPRDADGEKEFPRKVSHNMSSWIIFIYFYEKRFGFAYLNNKWVLYKIEDIPPEEKPVNIKYRAKRTEKVQQEKGAAPADVDIKQEQKAEQPPAPTPVQKPVEAPAAATPDTPDTAPTPVRKPVAAPAAPRHNEALEAALERRRQRRALLEQKPPEKIVTYEGGFPDGWHDTELVEKPKPEDLMYYSGFPDGWHSRSYAVDNPVPQAISTDNTGFPSGWNTFGEYINNQEYFNTNDLSNFPTGWHDSEMVEKPRKKHVMYDGGFPDGWHDTDLVEKPIVRPILNGLYPSGSASSFETKPPEDFLYYSGFPDGWHDTDLPVDPAEVKLKKELIKQINDLKAKNEALRAQVLAGTGTSRAAAHSSRGVGSGIGNIHSPGKVSATVIRTGTTYVVHGGSHKISLGQGAQNPDESVDDSGGDGVSAHSVAAPSAEAAEGAKTGVDINLNDDNKEATKEYQYSKSSTAETYTATSECEFRSVREDDSTIIWEAADASDYAIKIVRDSGGIQATIRNVTITLVDNTVRKFTKQNDQWTEQTEGGS